jgi:hypothetical protein
MSDVPPGRYGISVIHPRFDSLSVAVPQATLDLRPDEETVAMLAGPSVATIARLGCTAEERDQGRAMLRGHVRDALTSAPVPDALVSLTWNKLVGRLTGGPAGAAAQKVATRSDSAGRYDFCGLPDGVALTVTATSIETRSQPAQLVLSGDEVSVLDMILGKPTAVAVKDAGVIPTTSAVVASRPRNRVMAEFERRRRRGNGSYLTRAQIDRMSASRLTDLLRTMPGVLVSPGESGQLVVELRRTKSFTIEPMTSASTDSSGMASPVGQVSMKRCPAAFQVDGLPVDGGASADLEIRPEAIEAIEVYSPGLVPIEFSARNEQCGLVMIWTRAFANRPDPAQ